jgi:hypothetical protein
LEIRSGEFNGDGKLDVVAAVNCVSPGGGEPGLPNCVGSGNEIAVYLSNGDGTFQPAIFSGSLPGSLRSLVVGDFNNDGKLDVATASDCLSTQDCSSGSVTILLGNGDATFTQFAQYPLGGIVSQAGTLAVGDINNDGKLDLVAGIACYNIAVNGCGVGAVAIFSGNGDGTLAAPSIYATVGNSTLYPIVGDFNNDGKLDVIAGSRIAPGGDNSHSSLWILLSKSDSTLYESVDTLSFGGLDSLAVGDFNSDGKLDLATISGGATLQVLSGNGDGTFQAPVGSTTGLANPVTNGNAIVVVDLNGDGKPDLVVSGGFGGASVNGVVAFLNDGSGNFARGQSYPLGGWQFAPFVVGDFNGDGKTDVVMGSYCSESVIPGNHCPDGSIGVLFGNGDGTFQGPLVVPTSAGGIGVYSAGAADFNGDGIPDLFVSQERDPVTGQSGVGVFFGNPDGTYQQGTVVGSSAPAPIYSISADFNGDGKQDIAFVSPCDSTLSCNSPSVSVLLGNGDGTFAAPVTYPVGGSTPVGIVSGDFNGNKKPDIAVATQCDTSSCTQGTVSILLGNEDGTFQSAMTTGIGSGVAASISAGDFNRDGLMDVVVGNTNPTAENPYAELATILLNNGDGTLRVAGGYDAGGAAGYTRSVTVATGDVNHDGNVDVVVANTCESPAASDAGCANGSIGVLLGNGDGTFQPVQETVVTDGNLVSANLADVDGDGNLDLIASTTGGVMVARGKSDGTFQPPVIYGGLAEIQNEVLIVADLNNDGAPDIVQPDVSGNLAFFYNRGGTLVNLQSSSNPSAPGQSVTFSLSVTSSFAKNLSPTGTVSFYDSSSKTFLGTVSVVNGAAWFSISTLASGTHPIAASYSGDTNFFSRSASVIQVVTSSSAPTTTTLAASINPAQVGQSVTFTATVYYGATPAGSVSFKDGATLLATVPLTGNQATYSTSSLPAGSRPIVAIYSGDGANAGSTSPTLYESVIAVQPGAFLYGVVVDRASGQTLAGVIVKLCVPANTMLYGGSCTLITTTDASGTYSLSGTQVTSSSGGLLFQGQGYYANLQPYTITSLPTQVDASLLLGGTIIQGIVTDASTQQGIVGATVSFYPDSSLTSADGGFTIQVLTGALGAYAVDSSHFMEAAAGGFKLDSSALFAYASASGYLADPTPGFMASPPYPITQNYSLIPTGATALQGTVTDRSTGATLAGVSVKLCVPANILLYGGSCSPVTTTDANGQYSLSGAQARSASGGLLFQLQGHYANLQSFTITAVPTQLDASLLTGGTILQGTVTDASTQQGIVGATVSLSPDSSLTSADGGFTIQVLTGALGAYAVDSSHFMEAAAGGFKVDGASASAPGYLTLPAGGFTASPPYPITQNYSLIPTGATALQGIVTDRGTGTALAGVGVKLCVPANTLLYGGSCSLVTTTDASGHYSLSGAQATTTSGGLLFQLQGYYATLQPFTITSIPTQLDASLLTGGTILQGTVTDASTQQGIVGATVSFYPDSSLISAEGGLANTIHVLTGTLGAYAVDSSHFMEAAASGFKLDGGASFAYVSAPGYLTLPTAGFTATPPFPLAEDYSLIPNGTINPVTVTTTPSGLTFMVDGTSYAAQQSFQWPTSSVHSIGVSSPQGVGGTQQVFAQWSDGGPQAHQVTIQGAANYAASFGTQYQLTTMVSPTAGGLVTAGGWFNSGSSVSIQATANPGYQFSGFSGDLTGTTNPQNLLMNGPKGVTASFAPVAAATTTTVAAPTITYGGTASVTVSVSSGQGTVTGTVSLTIDNGAPLIRTLSNGSTVFSIGGLTAGGHGLSASYAAQGSFGASSATGTLQVNQAQPSISISNIPSNGVYGGSFTPIYAYGGDGTTSVTSGTPGTCTVSGNVVNFVGVGTCSLTAHAAAGKNYAAATGSPQSFTIAQAKPTISISDVPANAVYGGNFAPTYTYTGDGTTSATSSTTATCTVSGTVVNFVGVGTCTLTAHATSTANSAAATGSPQSFSIVQATPTISISNIPSNAVFGGSFTPTYAYPGNGKTSATSSTLSTCTVSNKGVVTFVGTGSCTLTAHATAATNYRAATGSPQSFTIAQAATTISIKNVPGNAKKGGSFTPTYNYIGDGTPSTISSTPGACIVSGSLVSFVGSGTCTLTAQAMSGTKYAATTGNPQSFAIK